MKQRQLTLPEWAFLEGSSHLGNTLEGRDILQHMRSYTIIEAISLDVVEIELKPEVKTRKFTYKNRYGIVENHLFAVHFSLAEFGELDEILDKAVQFYCKYLDWEDRNIVSNTTSKHN